MRIEALFGMLFGLSIIFFTLLGFIISIRWLYKKFNSLPNESNIETEENLEKKDETNEDTFEKVKKIEEIEKKEVKTMNKIELKNNITTRFIIIGIIALLMLIPLGNVNSVVHERSKLHNKVLYDIAKQWGNPQVVTGPALILPIIEKYNITETTKDKNGVKKTTNKEVFKHKNVVILPKLLNTDIKLKEHYRFRGIYKSLVYASNIAIEGKFVIPELSKLSDNLHKVRYDKAFLLMGLSDTKAIENVSNLSFGKLTSNFEPGIKLYLKGIDGGFHAPLELNKDKKTYDFNFNLKTNGSSYIRFSAFGEKTTVVVDSSWKHPSFQGSILPMERNITNAGFHAIWKIPSLARNFPQTWIYEEHSSYNVGSLLTGVDLFEPIALYSLVERSIKYGVLFILLTFLTFLVFEVTQKSKLHYVQYVLIGFSLGLFFLTLLSLSEHMRFLNAYVIASTITILSISIYTWFSNKNFKESFIIWLLLTALYAILYSLLQLEDYALLMGTGLLMAILFVLMWITRNLKVIEE